MTGPGAVVSRRYAAYAVALLALINIINYVDRNIIFVLFEAIKHELDLTDAELGWLGSAYVIVYALSAIPLGVLSDLKSRRAVVGVGVTVWSAFTALGGLARNFGQLFVCRSMVGVGEASYTPAAQSLIAMYFPGRGRALALGVFWSGLALGGVTGIWVGGSSSSSTAGERRSWPSASRASCWQCSRPSSRTPRGRAPISGCSTSSSGWS